MEFSHEMSNGVVDVFCVMAVVEATNGLVDSPKGMPTTN